MSSVHTGARERRRRVNAAKQALRDLNIQLTLLNRRYGDRVELKDVDWSCLDLLNRHGSLSPTALARIAGLRPATVTGILDRLQRAGWIVRERESGDGDRRAVTVRGRGERNPELFRLLSGMDQRMSRLFEEYSDAEIDVITHFLRRSTAAGRQSTEELAGD